MKKHVVICTLDQCRVDMLHAHPIFTELKQYGVFLDNVISYAPYTIASMHAIFSGVYGQFNGVDGYYKHEQFKSNELVTMPEYFKEAGYFTVGDFINKMTAPRKGWDVYEVHDEYNDDLITRHTNILTQYLNRDLSFIYLHYSNIHTEMVKSVFKVYDDNKEEYFSQRDENKNRYVPLVVRAGNYLSAVWNLIKEKVLKGEVIFIVITDHGVSLGERQGERAYGVFTFDYTLRVFHYFIAPRLIPQGFHCQSLLRTIDLLPTMLELVGIGQRNATIPIQGKSYVHILQDQQEEDRIAYAETGGLGGPFPSPYNPNVRCVRTNEWKLIYYTDTRQKSLYNVRHDPHEQHDIAQENPAKVLELWQNLIAEQPQ